MLEVLKLFNRRDYLSLHENWSSPPVEFDYSIIETHQTFEETMITIPIRLSHEN